MFTLPIYQVYSHFKMHKVLNFLLNKQLVHHLLLLLMEILIAHWEEMENLMLETFVPSHVMMVMS